MNNVLRFLDVFRMLKLGGGIEKISRKYRFVIGLLCEKGA